MKEKYEISVICLTYNSPLQKLKTTLDSILKQEDISMELIIADDGSLDNHRRDIEEYFINKNFTDYKLVLNEENRGTVCSLLSGMLVAEGEYYKGISPGDRLYEKDTLKKWLHFVKKNNIKWSFSDAFYYQTNGEKEEYLRGVAHPQNLKPYYSTDMKDRIWNYVVLKDCALGAAIISKTDITLAYLKRIQKKGVKYAEDYTYIVMMFDGIPGYYYPESAILYEYGSGISTNKEKKWLDRILHDIDLTDEVLKDTEKPDEFQKKMLRYLGRHVSLLTKITTKGKIASYMCKKFFPRRTKA